MVLSFLNDAFFTTNNLLNVLRQASLVFFMASGLTLVILTGKIDLSVGATVGLSACLAATVIKSTGSPWLGAVVGIGAGSLVGLANGVLVTRLRIPSFIATYGSLWIVQGITYYYMAGQTIYGFPPGFRALGSGYALGIPIPVYLMAGFLLIGGFFAKRTTYGQQIYAIGANSVAARLSGIPVRPAVAAAAWLISGDLVRSLAVFVAATPCPLILAAPVAFIAGVAQAARRGILVKGGAPLEALAHTHTVLFDKTGTLTVGGARLLSIEPAPGEHAEQVLQLGAALEQASHHVLAGAVVQAALDRGLPLPMPRDVRETMGSGIHGCIDGKQVSAGSRDLIYAHRQPEEWALRVVRRAAWRSALVVFVAVDGRTIGALLLADELRTETPHAIRMLRAARVARIVMVTGDHAVAAQTIGAALDLDAVLADRVPSDKVDAVRTEQRLYPTTMVGDGINDAPALAAANVGIAMGARGASASSEAADVVIIADRLDRVAEALIIAQRARRIAMESIFAGMGLSEIAMIAAMLGWLAPVPAALIQEMIDVAVILNALRALRPALQRRSRTLPVATGRQLRRDHLTLGRNLDRLRAIADMLDDVTPETAAKLIEESNIIVQQQVVTHERDDEGKVYPALARILTGDRAGLAAISWAHREILHLARLLARVAEDTSSQKVDRYLVRDAQRVIESIEVLVRMHVAQEEEIYEAVQAQ